MPIVEKNIGAALTIAEQDIYTTPAATTTRVLSARVTNRKGVAASDAIVQWEDADGAGLVNTSEFDVTKLSTYVAGISTALQTSDPKGAAFSADGLSYYIGGGNTGFPGIFQYALSTAYDVSTAVFSKNFSVSGEEASTDPVAMAISDDGLKFYVLRGNTTDTIYEYDLGIAEDISTAVYNGVTLVVTTESAQPFAMTFKPDGTTLYVGDNTSTILYQYTLSVAWDLSTAVYSTKSFTMSETVSGVRGLAFNPDGDKFILNADAGLYAYTLGTSWDVTTMAYASQSFLPAGVNTLSGGQFNATGSVMWLPRDSTANIERIVLPTPYEVTGASISSASFDVSAQDILPKNVAFSSDGLKMFMLGDTGNDVNEYALAEPWDVSSAAFTVAVTPGGGVTAPSAFFFNPDGTNLYIGSTTSTFQYSLTSFDISSLAYLNTSQIGGANMGKLCFISPDGKYRYALNDSVTTSIDRWELATAWDVSTAANSTTDAMTTITAGAVIRDIWFNNAGSRVWLFCDTSTIYEATLSTAWDLSTAAATTNYDTGSSTANGFYVTPDSGHMYTISDVSDEIDHFVGEVTLVDLSVHPIMYQEEVALSETLVIPGGLILEAGDKLQTASSSNYDLDITVSLQEIS